MTEVLETRFETPAHWLCPQHGGFGLSAEKVGRPRAISKQRLSARNRACRRSRPPLNSLRYRFFCCKHLAPHERRREAWKDLWQHDIAIRPNLGLPLETFVATIAVDFAAEKRISKTPLV